MNTITLAEATLDDVQASIDNLYVPISDVFFAVLQLTELQSQITTFAGICAFGACFWLGWIAWGRMRPRGGWVR